VLGEAGDDVGVERLADGARLLGPVEHRDAAHGGRQRLRRGERRAERALLYRAVHPPRAGPDHDRVYAVRDRLQVVVARIAFDLVGVGV